MGRVQITVSVEIDRPADAVYNFVTDVLKVSEWRPGVTAQDYSGDPFDIGSNWNDVSKFMGRNMVVYFEVTALEAGRHFETEMDGGQVSGINIWDFEPGPGDSSTVTLDFEGETSGWLASLASGLLRNQAQKDMERDLGNLKSKMESS
jgi:carbon monoxide dehydrogenase subunit G